MSSEDELSERDRETVAALFDYVEARGWCPMPESWNRLWELLLVRQRECGAPLPGAPLSMAASHDSPLLMMRVRLLDQNRVGGGVWCARRGRPVAAGIAARGMVPGGRRVRGQR